MVLKYRFACFRADLILRCPFDWFYADLRWTGARLASEIDILKANELKQKNWAVWSLSKDSSFNRQLLKRSRYFWRVGTIRYIKQSKYQRTVRDNWSRWGIKNDFQSKQKNWGVWSLSKDLSSKSQLLKLPRYFWRVGTIRYIGSDRFNHLEILN